MNFHVLTLFPEMIRQGSGTSITGRAIKNGIIGLNTVNIRDFSEDKHRRVDDYTYGGGAGMLMQPQPVYEAWKSVRDTLRQAHRVRTIYVTPQGQTFTQTLAEELAGADDLIFLCGHYEGIDERVLEETVTDYISIGDYVLTGGELAAMVMIDAIARLVPGVLHNDVSADTESFHGNLLEYPQYTRPELWHGKQVPQELLTGDPKDVAAWRMEQSRQRTRQRRPDLYEKYEEANRTRGLLLSEKITNADMISQIDQGHYQILSAENGRILLKNPLTGSLYYSDFIKTEDAKSRKQYTWEENLTWIKEKCYAFSKEDDKLYYRSAFGRPSDKEAFVLYVLTRREKLPVTGLYRPDGKPTRDGIKILLADSRAENAQSVLEMLSRFGLDETEAIDLLKREKVHALYRENKLAGVIARSVEGNITGLSMAPEEDRIYATALLTCACNTLLEEGKRPYIYVKEEDVETAALCRELGMYPSKILIYI